MHHAIFRILYPLFDKSFIFDSYSCRNGKGTHKAVKRLATFARKQSKNNTKICWFLKCDIKKFFDSINQEILINLIKNKVKDENALWLIEIVIKSFERGLPLGNITSQLFANIYLNELDQFIKHSLKIKYYIRYCDDFIIINNKEKFENYIFKINTYLNKYLKLHLHPHKIIIKKYHQGIDFLGYINFNHHTILRLKTKKRILRKINFKITELQENKISKESFYQTMQSYFGVLKHCNSYKLKREIVKNLDSKRKIL